MEKTIWFKPSCFAPEFRMTITIPANQNADAYINELLEGILNEETRLNAEWDFISD